MTPPFAQDTPEQLYAQDAELRDFIAHSTPDHPHYAAYQQQRRALLARLRALRESTPRGPAHLTIRSAA